MLPQKKNLLRRNAWYRQQLLQQAPTSVTSEVDSESESESESNTSRNYNHSATTAHKPQAANDSAIVC